MFLQSFNQCKVLRSSPPAKLENTSCRKFDWVGLVIPSLYDVWFVHWLVIFTLCIFTEKLSLFLSLSLFLIHKQSREHTHTLIKKYGGVDEAKRENIFGESLEVKNYLSPVFSLVFSSVFFLITVCRIVDMLV